MSSNHRHQNGVHQEGSLFSASEKSAPEGPDFQTATLKNVNFLSISIICSTVFPRSTSCLRPSIVEAHVTQTSVIFDMQCCFLVREHRATTILDSLQQGVHQPSCSPSLLSRTRYATLAGNIRVGSPKCAQSKKITVGCLREQTVYFVFYVAVFTLILLSHYPLIIMSLCPEPRDQRNLYRPSPAVWKSKRKRGWLRETILLTGEREPGSLGHHYRSATG